MWVDSEITPFPPTFEVEAKSRLAVENSPDLFPHSAKVPKVKTNSFGVFVVFSFVTVVTEFSVRYLSAETFWFKILVVLVVEESELLEYKEYEIEAFGLRVTFETSKLIPPKFAPKYVYESLTLLSLEVSSVVLVEE